mgnify:CR=1 FL=1
MTWSGAPYRYGRVQAQIFLAHLLLDAEPGCYLNVRYRLRSGGMAQEFIPLERLFRNQLEVIDWLLDLGEHTDVYVGVARGNRRLANALAAAQDVVSATSALRLPGTAAPPYPVIERLSGDGWLLADGMGATASCR